MGRKVSYADAVRLLGGDQAVVVKLVDGLVGAGMIALVGPFRDMLGWLDAKAELSRITEQLIGRLAERRSTLSRYERTERLQAAHAVLALTAFFEALSESKDPIGSHELELTPEEQRSLGGIDRPSVAGWSAPVPGPVESHEDFRGQLAEYYGDLSVSVARFLQGLAAWERLTADQEWHARRALKGVPTAALSRYDSLLGRLAADFPEVAFWAGMREHAAVQARLREVKAGMATLGEVLHEIASGRVPDDRRRALALVYQEALLRPIVESGEVPSGIRVPTLQDAFLAQCCRVVPVAANTPVNSEDWWEGQPVRNDLLAFLARYLTSVAAATAPLLLLGQPGSGKSVLAKVLAAQLPATDFLPVLVTLRTVPAAADVQDQIEHAVHADIGERVDWPALARSAGDALPVVILDGFDELLQATGVSQTDYLLRVVRFQQREAALGRPVAVIVTSRTSVADRATVPANSIAVRLEPFDENRVTAWLGIWNRCNAERYASTGEAPLDPATVMRYPDLAGQPLLLLMLALYDAEGNALRDAGKLRLDQLYDRLLERFARRQVEKLGDGLPPRDRDRRVESELRTLSVVALAMFNRGTQWVSEAQLDADLQALQGLTGTRRPESAGFRAPLRAADLALGSFFFVHRARAHRDDRHLDIYEFLHATFGEFLVARLIHRVVLDLIAREQASTFPSGAAADDDLLQALTSFAPLAGRRQTAVFLRSIVASMSDSDREDWSDVAVRLFRSAPMPRPTRAFDEYAPRLLSVPWRIAAYTANLLVLALCAGDVTASRLLGVADPTGEATVVAWHEMALLWHSQGSASGWAGLLDLVEVDRISCGARRDIRLAMVADDAAQPQPVDLRWVVGHEIAGRGPGVSGVHQYGDPLEFVRREAHFTCDETNDWVQAALAPLNGDTAALGGLVYRTGRSDAANCLADMLSLITVADRPPGERRALYRACVRTCRDAPQFCGLLVHQVAADQEVEPSLVYEVVQAVAEVSPRPESLRIEIVRCIAAHLSAKRARGVSNLATMANRLLPDAAEWTAADVDAAIRLAELHLPTPKLPEAAVDRILRQHGNKRPDFVSRISVLIGPATPR